jgi:uncharacterized repeat protein (TIGR01451 family)
MSKTASQPNGNTASGTMSFALVVVNAGPSTAANITVTDTVPAGLNVLSVSGSGLSASNVGNVVSGTATSLASGATATLTIVVSMSNTTSAHAGLHQHGQRDQHDAGPDTYQQHQHDHGDRGAIE